MSGPRDSLSVSTPIARDNRRFSGRPDFVANEQGRHSHSNLGAGALRAQPGVVNGDGISREHRPGDVVPLGLRCLDVPPESTSVGRTIVCAQLPDQNCAASFFAGVFFLLAVARQEWPFSDCRRNHYPGFVD